ncbi:hypothetical protein BJ742DRAFT_717944 [Cladochytrium replicatum]|nr:hypothetical protein BJ742DRAFT_717944 [Cladochytrium replicatum]
MHQHSNLYHRNSDNDIIATADSSPSGSQSPDLTPQQSQPHSSNKSGTNGTSSKRRKAARACQHCQRAHLTCDDLRPCTRCIKRDLADTCADGSRKRAKYLLEGGVSGGETPAVTSPSLTATPGNSALTTFSQLLSDSTMAHSSTDPALPPPHTLETPHSLLPLPAFNFGSETINLEYAFLSSMLNAPHLQSPQFTDLSAITPELQHAAAVAAAVATSSPSALPQLSSSGVLGSHPGFLNPDPVAVAQQQQNFNGAAMEPPQPPPPRLSRPQSAGSGLSKRSGVLHFPENTSPREVYTAVVKPYDYREGFHYLVKYVKERMEKRDIMRICRSLADFRPSFMAQILNLSEEDLIFMEKSFQRTLLEFDKLIGYSGTPTVVWRRTGEIALVGKEFSLLTEWRRDELLTKKTYIYELMDSASAVDYWEKFSLIAFDNSQQSVMTNCVLVTPSKRGVPCAMCFTIKRDIFDVPLAIVGNFLPLFKSGRGGGSQAGPGPNASAPVASRGREKEESGGEEDDDEGEEEGSDGRSES